MILHSFRLSYVWNSILAHIWDASGFPSEIGCDTPRPYVKEKWTDQASEWLTDLVVLQSPVVDNFPNADGVFFSSAKINVSFAVV
jgi:hypothetical protein